MGERHQWLTKSQSETFCNFLKDMCPGNYSIQFSSVVEEVKTFGGVIVRADLIEIENTNSLIKRFIIKRTPRSEEALAKIPFEDMYNIEIYVYSTIFQQFTQIQIEKNLPQIFKPYPDFYQSLNTRYEEMLVLQDMNLQGYVSPTRHLPLDDNHIVLLVRQYAKIHALSYSIKDQKPQLYQEFRNNMRNYAWKNITNDESKSHCNPRLTEALKALDFEEDRTCYDQYLYFTENWMSIWTNLILKSQYPVVSHIDCGISNSLFKYKESSNTPVDAVILDWQHSRMDSPAIDLVTLILAAADISTLIEDFNDLIEEYYKALALFLEELGSDPSEVFPFEVLQEELKTYGVLGLLMAMLLLYDYTIVDQNQQGNDGSSCELQNKARYGARVRAAILSFYKMGYNFK